MKKISILIATYNRLEKLKQTLDFLSPHLQDDVELIICDDRSTDGTFEFLQHYYSEFRLIRNKINSGYLYSRNRLLNLVRTPYAISLDDDANFLSENPIDLIIDHFEKNPKCGVLAFRIYWGNSIPSTIKTTESSLRVKSFVGCGHAWRIKAWHEIPNYPEWFEFYGEEDFSSFQLFKKKWEVCYLPKVLIHHRVSLKQRKIEKDYAQRLRRSLRSGWYLYFLFLPWKLIPRKIVYSIWMQLKLQIFKGNYKAFTALMSAILDIIRNIRFIAKSRKPLTREEVQEYKKIASTKIYWIPEK
jgi:glycosyltransferase involved in cell wall biosynthesis